MLKEALGLLYVTLFTFTPSAAARPADMNSYVLKAVANLAQERATGGYRLSAWYTKKLDYTQPAEIPQGPATRPEGDEKATMCVAAVAESIIEAIKLYGSDRMDTAVTRNMFEQLPATSWSRGNLYSILPYIFMRGQSINILRRGARDTPHIKGIIAYTRGTGDALALWRIGEELSFSGLKPGDFINFNRTKGSGHAGVFLNYIGADNRYTTRYLPDVIGFEYFSAQGGGNPQKGIPPKPDAGLGYRDAYFGMYTGHGVSSARGVTHPSDRTVIGPAVGDIRLLNGGRLWMPASWKVPDALRDIQARVSRNTTRGGQAAVNRALQEENSVDVINFEGVEG